ncbi:uncharacterized protein PSANT_04190 [Moesziomyces antarcticus]|uniref:Uncharacterized protein n=1 Tax=Pseudozyma antarctica TaxID=84753 RepID=A0A5C3FPZ2_PSEA2|nr:uncharacterized protein PSANT_04190 [Moesziomyces antarcticus]
MPLFFPMCTARVGLCVTALAKDTRRSGCGLYRVARRSAPRYGDRVGSARQGTISARRGRAARFVMGDTTAERHSDSQQRTQTHCVHKWHARPSILQDAQMSDLGKLDWATATLDLGSPTATR